MYVHECGACFAPMNRHSEMCVFGCFHWPALCCPGCDCESFQEAHPPDTVLRPGVDRVFGRFTYIGFDQAAWNELGARVSALPDGPGGAARGRDGEIYA